MIERSGYTVWCNVATNALQHLVHIVHFRVHDFFQKLLCKFAFYIQMHDQCTECSNEIRDKHHFKIGNRDLFVVCSIVKVGLLGIGE